MELRERIKLYLETRAVPVSRNELLSIASVVGISRDSVYLLTKEMQVKPEIGDVHIGIWWGYKNNSKPREGEMKTLWFCAHPMTEKEKADWMSILLWFNEQT